MEDLKKMIVEGLKKQLEKAGKTVDKAVMAKAWAKFMRETKNIQGTLGYRQDEIGTDGCVDCLEYFYEETEKNVGGRNTANHLSDRAFRRATGKKGNGLLLA